MEGILWKWTNYWSGWQPRWFILDNGVLAYYKSQEEVNQGCKGFIKMSVCEIIVNSTDNTRLDLVIPSEQHFYLKAATPQERQQWLVALGSAKASLSARQKKDSANASPDMLKSKKSELRLYCDLLMQQVHTVKSSAMDKSPPDLATMSEATSLLGATCDTFIKTLEECMKLANANFPYELPQITDSALPPSLTHNNAFRKNNRASINRSSSADRVSVNSASSSVYDEDDDDDGDDYDPYLDTPCSPLSECGTDDTQEELEERDTSGQEAACALVEEKPTNSGVSKRLSMASGSSSASADGEEWSEINDNVNNNEDCKEELDIKEDHPNQQIPEMQTFFSNLKVSFLNLQMDNNGGIPTKHFLDSCAIVITIFEMFGSPIFAPMRIDVMGNLKKITEKFKKDPERFVMLQNIIRYEMANNSTMARNSATDAILWLKRGLEFVYEFLLEFARGNPDLKHCALNAYNRSLKQYHGWIIRGIISAATHTVPSRQEVLFKLAVKPNDIYNPLYEEALKEDARRFIKAMDNIIRNLNEFYSTHKLDRKEVV